MPAILSLPKGGCGEFVAIGLGFFASPYQWRIRYLEPWRTLVECFKLQNLPDAYLELYSHPFARAT